MAVRVAGVIVMMMRVIVRHAFSSCLSLIPLGGI
jgi:hypothetical protein